MVFDFLISFFCFFLLVIFILVGVSFFTLFERKVLGYVHLRKGPNKVSFFGFLQPFSDAIKLFCKENFSPSFSNYLFYYFSPVFNLFFCLSVWVVIPYFSLMFGYGLGLVFLLCCLGFNVYSIMIAGWSSNSNYSLLGGLRSVAQTISYEVSLFLIMLSFVVLIGNYCLISFYYFQYYVWYIFFLFPLCLCLFSSFLADVNRTPFDFAEGESELVSGFNVEYMSGGFVLIFLGEYCVILFMSLLSVIFFFGCDLFSISSFLKMVFFSFLFVWIRSSLPRFRYDKLMSLAWKCYLPLSLNYLIFFVGFKLFVISLFIYCIIFS
uniref:NADH-ubiquinone oxidoreductase chain 1 n=1 Tax=Pulchriphyllium giganteum TaxID=591861 RepID=E2RUT0_9NEOP|nr:NADH dehydrogenase subunit 1 [Pulchriphyllium giganteum]WID87119.1 NADH dehydrogenase subunit 1 [Pulchriphyllium giganteum]BAJ24464.1 NADH dehydrogenase subunit 1 [Pulchriphyllium giganteum]